MMIWDKCAQKNKKLKIYSLTRHWYPLMMTLMVGKFAKIFGDFEWRNDIVNKSFDMMWTVKTLWWGNLWILEWVGNGCRDLLCLIVFKFRKFKSNFIPNSVKGETKITSNFFTQFHLYSLFIVHFPHLKLTPIVYCRWWRRQFESWLKWKDFYIFIIRKWCDVNIKGKWCCVNAKWTEQKGKFESSHFLWVFSFLSCGSLEWHNSNLSGIENLQTFPLLCCVWAFW